MGGRGSKGRFKVRPGGGGGGTGGGGSGGGGSGGGGSGGGGGTGTGGSLGGGGPGIGGSGAGGGAGIAEGRFERRPEHLPGKYKKQLEQRFEEGTPDAQRVYDKYITNGGAVEDGHIRDGAYYSPDDNKVYMNFRKDSDAYDSQPGSTWYHEHGHYVDFNSGRPSRDDDFYEAIENDIRSVENRWLADHGLERNSDNLQVARQAIGREMVLKGGRLTRGIQDIYGGVLREYNALEPGTSTRWGHKWDYWTRGYRPYQVTCEAWANMFDASFSRDGSNAMREYLPTAFEWFEIAIGGI